MGDDGGSACTDDWKFAADQFALNLKEKVLVHCSSCNAFKLTLDGVDIMGERLAEEVCQIVIQKPELQKISFVAHSVGGLVARYAIGKLYERCGRSDPQETDSDDCDKGSMGTISGLVAMNFITVATPHLGSRGNKQVPFLFGVSALERLACLVIHLIFRRTGKHLFLTDNDEGRPPLLLQMIDDSLDIFFMSALKAFRRRVTYANVGYDHIVGWRTSSIRRHSELPEWAESMNEKYPHVVHEEYSEGFNASDVGENRAKVDLTGNLEEELVNGLSQLSWERVDVSFHRSKMRFAAHSVIQVKNTILHSEGADVIQHMIDHFDL
ncbi:alpha/beta-Hydrolases superfamily protein isoform X2 [Wolffia australiana]